MHLLNYFFKKQKLLIMSYTMQTNLNEQTESAIKDFISLDNSENLSSLVLELLDGDHWDDEIYYFCDTMSALMTLMIDPKVNKKYFRSHPRMAIVTGPHLARLNSFFIQLKTVAKARAEIQLQHTQEYYKTMTESQVRELLTKYNGLKDKK